MTTDPLQEDSSDSAAPVASAKTPQASAGGDSTAAVTTSLRRSWTGLAGWRRASAIAAALITVLGLAGTLIAPAETSPEPGAVASATERPGDAPAPRTTGPDSAAGNRRIPIQGLTGGPGFEFPPPSEGGDDGEAAPAETPPSDAAPSAADAQDAPDTPQGLGLQALSPFAVNLGLGFSIGFALGFVGRLFVRMALVVAGIQVMILLLLQWGGIVEIRWDVATDAWNGFGSWFGAQVASLPAFLQSQIPAVGGVAGGFAIGFRKGF